MTSQIQSVNQVTVFNLVRLLNPKAVEAGEVAEERKVGSDIGPACRFCHINVSNVTIYEVTAAVLPGCDAESSGK